MPLSWNEIRYRALGFSRECPDECSEDAEAKSFWDGFFNVFGISRRRVAFLFQRYQELTAPLAAVAAGKSKRRISDRSD
jgi:hypothetical protein